MTTKLNLDIAQSIWTNLKFLWNHLTV